MTQKTSQSEFALRTPVCLRKGLAGLFVTSIIMLAGAAHAGDVFGTATPNAQAASDLRDRLTVLEKEIKDLKSNQGSGNTGFSGMPSSAERGKLIAPPPPPVPGLEGLPSRGKDKQELLLVEKDMAHEVIGEVNGNLVVRDGDSTFVMSAKEFKAFETAKRKKIVRKLTIDSVGTDFKLSPPGSPAETGADGVVNQMGQAAAVINQAKAMEANGGKLPSPAPMAPPPVSKAPAAAPVIKK